MAREVKIPARWLTHAMIKYVGNDTAKFKKGEYYLGKFLIFEDATLVLCSTEHYCYQTKTKNWDFR